MRRVVLALGGLVIMAVGLMACGGGTASRSSRATTTTAVPAASTTSPPTVTAHAPTAQITLTGDPGVAGALSAPSITCGLPSLDGSLILVIAKPAEPTWSVRITVSPTSVLVGVDSGSGPQYQERDFTGTGVTGFDAARGVHLNSTLSEGPGQAPTKLGAIRSISGTIDCGSQSPGTSSVVFSGNTADGAFSGGLDPVHVGCSSGTALIIGIGRVGGAAALVDFNVRGGTFGFFTQSSPPTHDRQYQGRPSTTTQTATGFHVDGDAVEVVAAGASPHTVHLAGDITCPA